MKKALKKALMAAAVIALFGSTDAFADGGDIAAGIKAGTAGGGVELTAGITSFLNVRSGFNYFSYEGNTTESDINYDYDLTLSSFPVLIDLHPFEGAGFRVSGGIFINHNKADGESTSQTLEIGGMSFDSDLVGSLTGKVDFDSVAPYLVYRTVNSMS